MEDFKLDYLDARKKIKDASAETSSDALTLSFLPMEVLRQNRTDGMNNTCGSQ